jgi:hypothetical protein
MMLVARQSFTYVDPFDGEKKAVHRGRTRVAEGHELVQRYPHRWEQVDRRQDARSRFRDQLDRAQTYTEYRGLLDELVTRLEVVEQRGESACQRVLTPRGGGVAIVDHERQLTHPRSVAGERGGIFGCLTRAAPNAPNV